MSRSVHRAGRARSGDISAGTQSTEFLGRISKVKPSAAWFHDTCKRVRTKISGALGGKGGSRLRQIEATLENACDRQQTSDVRLPLEGKCTSYG